MRILSLGVTCFSKLINANCGKTCMIFNLVRYGRAVERLPIGIDDFGELVRGKYYFCDKTSFIRDIITSDAKVTLITRPRRWGKTLNMSMLQHFFAPEVRRQSTKGLFDNLDIAKFDGGEYIEQYQGKYPTIFLSFKNVEGENFEACLEKFYELILNIYDQFRYLLKSDKLGEIKLERLKRISHGRAKQSQLESSLYLLCECLYEHHDNSQVCVLIDEYDAPLNCAYNKKDEKYFGSVVEFIRRIFSTTLKDNPYLWKGVLTGILRVAKEDIFSGLNNISVYTILDERYKAHFGFTEQEVQDLFELRNFTNIDEAKTWYNGYNFNKLVMYNPWSIIKCLSEHGRFDLYWVNASGNYLVEHSITSKEELYSKFSVLMQRETITVEVDANLCYRELHDNECAFWSLLLFSGYLTCESSLFKEDGLYECKVRIPNDEVHNLYRRFFKRWFLGKFSSTESGNEFLNHFRQGNVIGFMNGLQEFLSKSASTHDTGKKKTNESFFHGLLLGLFYSQGRDYTVRSNGYSGHGRFDLQMNPRKKGLVKAWLFEFKMLYISNEKGDIKDKMKKKALEAFNQIIDQRYFEELKDTCPDDDAILCGICFYGKSAVAAYSIYDLAKGKYDDAVYAEPL